MKKAPAKSKRKTVKITPIKSKGIRHHHITRVMYIAMVAFMLTTALVVGISVDAQPAQATIGALPFGGTLVTAVPANPVVGGCPAHITVMDITGSFPKLIGLTIPLSPLFSNGAFVFDYHNIYTPGVWQLGEYYPIPIFNCVLPYPVFSEVYNPEYLLYQHGTGLTPGY